MEKISIVIPAYNEEKRIAKTLESYNKFFNNLRKNRILDYEILVVINNTKDKTEDIVKKYSKKHKEINYLNLKPGGKGFAVREGFKYLLKGKNDFIGFVDADCSTKPEAFYDLILNLKDYDAVIGSRYVRGAKVDPKPAVQRIIVSRIFNILVRALFFMNYKDTQCGAKVFKRQVIAKVVNQLDITQWAFDIELLYKTKKLGYNILEFPTTWADEQYSKINFLKAGPRMVLAIIRLRLVNSKLKFIIKAYDKLPSWIKIHNKIF